MIRRNMVRSVVGTALVLVCFAGFTAGCATTNNGKRPSHTQDDVSALRSTVAEFHKNMRWLRYEQAGSFVHESYRSTFMGRYEELGDDFKIVSLEVKKVDFDPKAEGESLFATIILVQEWYKEPVMTVKKDKLVERWERVQGVGWRLKERIDKKEWEERRKKEREAAKKTASPTTDSPKPDATTPAKTPAPTNP